MQVRASRLPCGLCFLLASLMWRESKPPSHDSIQTALCRPGGNIWASRFMPTSRPMALLWTRKRNTDDTSTAAWTCGWFIASDSRHLASDGNRGLVPGANGATASAGAQLGTCKARRSSAACVGCYTCRDSGSMESRCFQWRTLCCTRVAATLFLHTGSAGTSSTVFSESTKSLT